MGRFINRLKPKWRKFLGNNRVKLERDSLQVHVRCGSITVPTLCTIINGYVHPRGKGSITVPNLVHHIHGYVHPRGKGSITVPNLLHHIHGYVHPRDKGRPYLPLRASSFLVLENGQKPQNSQNYFCNLKEPYIATNLLKKTTTLPTDNIINGIIEKGFLKTKFSLSVRPLFHFRFISS